MSIAPVVAERLEQGWFLFHLLPNPSGHRVLEAQAEGPDGQWRICPYGAPELETYRPSQTACRSLADDVVAGKAWPVEESSS